MNHAGELAALTRHGPPACRDRHHDRPGAPRILRQRGGDRRRQGRDLRRGWSRAAPRSSRIDSPHRDRLIAAARPMRARYRHVRPRRGRRRARDLCRARPEAAARWSRRSSPTPQLSFTIAQPGAHWVANALAVLAAVEAVGGDLAAAGLALADMGGLQGRGERHRVRGRRRRRAADRRKLQRQSGLDGGDAARCSARRRSPAGGSPCSARCASWAPTATTSTPRSPSRSRRPASIMRSSSARRWKRLRKRLAARSKMAHVPDAASALPLARAAIGPGDAMLVKGSNSIGLAAPRRGAGGPGQD